MQDEATYGYLVVIHIPFAAAEDGAVLTGDMWVKDLRGMAAHLGPITVAAPQLDAAGFTPEQAGSFRFARVEPHDPQVRFLPLPHYASARSFLRNRRAASRLLAGYVARAGIVHVDTGGWPIAPGEIAFRHARRMNKPIVLLLGDGADPIGRFDEKIRRETSKVKKLATRLIRGHFERFFRRAAAQADLTLFHNPVTARRFRPFAKRSETFARSFVEDEFLLSDSQLAARERQLEVRGPLRLLMAGRLIPMKGVDHAIHAVAQARRQGADITLTLLGSGDQEDSLRRLAAEQAGSAVHFRGKVEYGPALFEIFHEHHGLLVCNLTDEISRNVLLGMAMGCVVIGYRNPSMDPVTTHLENAWLAPAGSIENLTAGLLATHQDRALCRSLIRGGLQTARRNTFQACHARRAELIQQYVSPARLRCS